MTLEIIYCKKDGCENRADEISTTPCYEHCQSADDGEHRLDWSETILKAEDIQGDLLVDVHCYYCGQSTGFIIQDAEVVWS